VGLAFTLTNGSAQASPTLSGKWSAGALQQKWVEGTWSAACGPKPTRGGGAGAVVVTQSGSELTIAGGGRNYSTRACWTTEPGMNVVAHSGGARNWKTTCKSPSGAPRQVTTVTTLSATDDTLTFYETGQYQFTVGTEHCTASVGRYRTYRLVERAGGPIEGSPAQGAETSAAAQAETEKGSERCAEPGPPKRIELSPAHRFMSPGESHVFTATAFDDKGCRLSKRPQWTLEGAQGAAEVDASGKVRVLDDAPEGELEVVASIGSRRESARVEVASSDRLAALLARGTPDVSDTPEAPRPLEPALASQSLGADAAVAEDRASRRKLAFVGLLGVVALGLAFAGLLVVRRTRRTNARASARSASSIPPSVPVSASTDAASPRAAQALPIGNDASRGPSAANPPSGAMKKLCPTCGRQYPGTSQFCGQDGTILEPLD
jgi:hypothetical protein